MAPKVITSKRLARRVAARLGTPVAAAEAHVAAALLEIGRALLGGGAVELRGLGSFRRRRVGWRLVRQIGSGRLTRVRAAPEVVFSAGRLLGRRLAALPPPAATRRQTSLDARA